MRRARTFILFALLALLLPAPPLTAQADPGVEALIREGAWDAVRERLAAAHEADRSLVTARSLAGVLLVTGHYEEVEPLLERWAAGDDADAGALLLQGRALLALGEAAEAEARFARGAATGGREAQLARRWQGEALLVQGRHEEAYRLFDTFIDLYNEAPTLRALDVEAVAGAVTRLGAGNPQLFRDALMVWDQAIEADPGNVEAHLGVGNLFLGRYNAPDARQGFRGALALQGNHPDALLGLARVAASEGLSDAAVLVDRALHVNPRHPSALALRARLHLAAEEMEATRDHLERALAVNPAHSGARAIEGALLLLRGDRSGFERVASGVLERNPADAAFFEEAAELVSRGRLYAEAAELAARGVEVDPLAWGARATLGVNLMRTGAVDEARAILEEAFEGDPYNVRVKNTLDLLDSMDDFRVWEGEGVHLYLDPQDGEALAIYMLEVSERALRELSERYRHTLSGPVRVEAFRQRADFSVRTVGITGLGALGVAFGPVVAMESPAARGPEGFHWASVLWHELAHVFHLSMTDHRVPRWFTEGLAVHEERRAGPGWGRLPTLGFLEAWESDRLHPPSRLSTSFVRPRSPDEVLHAYTLGSMVMAWIEEEHGFEAILRMLEGYRAGKVNETVIEEVFGMDAAAFDESFERWFRTRWEGPLRAAAASRAGRERSPDPAGGRLAWLRARIADDPADLEARLELAARLGAEEAWEEALGELEAARELFPHDPDPAGALRLLAEVHRAEGRAGEAREALEAFVEVAGGHYGAWIELADLRREGGDREGEARALEHALEVYPFESQLHERLAGLLHELGAHEREVRERRALLALGPVDRAGALYQLGRAQFGAGDLAGARRSALGALELAPRFGEAQELLLAIAAAGGGDR